ncbi:MAG: acyl-CoA dehydrogenase [Deltaproteobacteria bacterium]|jgi:alkylation response protein AidB-like acyl-CoA dehydrogenase|nr:acyl-CoA dehydrogenase [Deltaproteobacteria bacterium]MBT6432996.1 acyl-CoA dehydrogenase [Deltaproteobacteria bacterium]MBT6488207.1 acyl-CoA dehydrogenase [Deltaproteobacteria bacterium]
MLFELTAEQSGLREIAAAYAKDTLMPDAQKREDGHDIEPETIKGLGDRGLLGVNIRKEYGGSEAGVVGYAVAVREIAAGDPAVAVTMAVTNMVGEVLQAYGTKEQRQAYIPKLTSGEFFGGAFALSEPAAGSDAGALATRAERVGDNWVINGEKLWITTGDRAGVVVVWARTGGAGAKGISCFLVDGGAPGLSSGKPEEKLGLRASHTVSLSLADVTVPHSAMLGQEGEGFKIAMMALDGGRVGISSQSLGMAYGAMNRAREIMLSDKQHGATQGMLFKLANIGTECDAAWLLALRAAWLKESDQPFSREAAMAKVYATEAANKATQQALQIGASHGHMQDSLLSRYFRDVRVTRIYEGTSEVQRIVISRSLLRDAQSGVSA